MKTTAVRSALIVVTLLLTFACDATDPSPPEALPNVALRTGEPFQPGVPQVCMAALLPGVLVRHPASGVALRDTNGRVHEIIWPHGYSAVPDGPRLAVVDARGLLVAHEGDRISLGGGEIDNRGTWSTCGDVDVLRP